MCLIDKGIRTECSNANCWLKKISAADKSVLKNKEPMSNLPEIDELVYIITTKQWGTVRYPFKKGMAHWVNVYVKTTGVIQAFPLYNLSRKATEYCSFFQDKCIRCKRLGSTDLGALYYDKTFSCVDCKKFGPLKCSECHCDFDIKIGKLFGDEKTAACVKCLAKFKTWCDTRTAPKAPKKEPMIISSTNDVCLECRMWWSSDCSTCAIRINKEWDESGTLLGSKTPIHRQLTDDERCSIEERG